MPHVRISHIVTCGLLAMAGGASDLVPARHAIGQTRAVPPAEVGTIRLSGVVRDFKRDHPDFDIAPLPVTVGHFAGGVADRLDAHGLPQCTSSPLRVQTQWRDDQGRPIPRHLANPVSSPCGAAPVDRRGTTGPEGGAITSKESFSEWFRDTLGANISTGHAIELVRGDDGAFEFIDTEFFPVDGRFFGDEGLAHNHFFTFVVEGSFVYDACAEQFIELAGGDGLWLFVGDTLAVDLGGVLPPTSQHLDLDRLGLDDGAGYRVKLFVAQRNPAVSSLAIRTNVPLRSTNPVASVMSGFD